jgi:hypothetical protein
MAAPASEATPDTPPTATGDGAHSAAQQGNVSAIAAIAPTSEPAPPKRPAHYLWAVLIARIYEVFPLVCPICGGPMRLIAFITHSADIRQILNHIGVESEPPNITPARGPPLWDGFDAHDDEAVQPAPSWDDAAQAAPDFEVDERVNW